MILSFNEIINTDNENLISCYIDSKYGKLSESQMEQLLQIVIDKKDAKTYLKFIENTKTFLKNNHIDKFVDAITKSSDVNSVKYFTKVLTKQNVLSENNINVLASYIDNFESIDKV